MNPKFKLVFLVALLPFGAVAQSNLSPRQIFDSDEVLTTAIQDIGKMKVDELRLFADFLAACSDSLNQDQQIQNGCEVARGRYEIEFGSGRALDRLMFAVGLIQEIMRREDAIKRHSIPDPLPRLLDIERTVRATANARFAALRRANPN